jgi:hypothetical protein
LGRVELEREVDGQQAIGIGVEYRVDSQLVVESPTSQAIRHVRSYSKCFLRSTGAL